MFILIIMIHLHQITIVKQLVWFPYIYIFEFSRAELKHSKLESSHSKLESSQTRAHTKARNKNEQTWAELKQSLLSRVRLICTPTDIYSYST